MAAPQSVIVIPMDDDVACGQCTGFVALGAHRPLLFQPDITCPVYRYMWKNLSAPPNMGDFLEGARPGATKQFNLFPEGADK
jgi:hypothetical protein